MSVGFGFSVGDFLAALQLVGVVIDALRESSDSKAKFHELLSELYALETALLRVKRIDLDESQHSEKLSTRLTLSTRRATVCGPKMIEERQFLIEESRIQTVIDLKSNWETCFYQGQRVAMSMLFAVHPRLKRAQCPRCMAECGSPFAQEVICPPSD
ncbi:hypothetical protein B0H63DRAFT_449745 [Podospora didyma]|uniref:Fungal N-terminal domain-containing protein n=1 Tax=Podospora didyma TaxID=330526 RepID=A0AAE0TZX4_9PEZI|nr:hypothetical protein B0H63DRAFT_449745 [Podospora didyma]